MPRACEASTSSLSRGWIARSLNGIVGMLFRSGSQCAPRVDANEHAELRGEIEQVGIARVLAHRARHALGRQVAGDRRPRRAEVGGLEDVVGEVVAAVVVDRHVGGAVGMPRRLDAGEPRALRQAGEARLPGPPTWRRRRARRGSGRRRCPRTARPCVRGDSASAVMPGKYGTPSSIDSVFSLGMRPISGSVDAIDAGGHVAEVGPRQRRDRASGTGAGMPA